MGWTKEEDQLWDAARDGKDGEIERLIDAGTHVDCVNPDRVRSPPLLPSSSTPPLTHRVHLRTAPRR